MNNKNHAKVNKLCNEDKHDVTSKETLKLIINFGATEFIVQVPTKTYVHQLIEKLLSKIKINAFTVGNSADNWCLIRDNGFKVDKEKFIGYDPNDLEDYDVPYDYINRGEYADNKLPSISALADVGLKNNDKLRLLRRYVCDD